MKAIVVNEPGGPEALVWGEAPDPTCAPDEVVLKIEAAGVNRADVMQRKGFYPPPKGITEIIGLEAAGTIVEVGDEVTDWTAGDQVCALLSGGGYAEKVNVPAVQLLPLPSGLSMAEGAALTEVVCTVWSNLWAPFSTGRVQPEETLLVHGGSSGIGTMAIQLAKAKGNPIVVTVGTDEKARFCRDLGAETINYKDEDFVERAREMTAGRGVDVILDNMGAKYLDRNIDAVAPDGRIVTIGMQGGNTAELKIGKLLGKRVSYSATSLRGRPVHGPNGKAAVVAGVTEDVWPLISSGEVKPIVDSTMPMSEAAKAHERMESSEHIGKIILTN
ncbi:NAD(P)H-quinone oxidoreductase [Blastococcus sp. Marseille-P5729]|uniref:NAD(P)H-quinone oxidoreductase n=1 Tax=Blastococcus sp. Marseille-P5729 TaxID=2086582 RepID=UPI000D10012F|nr:NAD(P)H-quinone oxidoreductase [Blastococcus sp. Marseille-P5729]